MSKQHLIIVVFLLLFSLGCALGGGNDAPEPSEEGPVPVSKPDEKSSGGGGSVNLKDIPVYPGAKVAEELPEFNPPGSMQYEVVDKIIYEVDEVEAVHEYYLDKMPEAGWEKIMAMQFPEESALSTWISPNREDGVLISVGPGPENKIYLSIMQIQGIN